MTTYEGEAIAACQRWMDRCKQAEASMTLPEIQSMLRHKNATTTCRYLHTLNGGNLQIDGVFARN